jgi:cell division protein FtsZ
VYSLREGERVVLQFAEENHLAKIKVIGIGGGGGNAINTMISAGLEGVEFIAANTDAQALSNSLAPIKVQIGSALTKGLGAGSDPDIGRRAALEDVDKFAELIEGADMVFITTGLGGGTGTGGAPIIAELAKQKGALTVGVVTKPFLFEGRRRTIQAEIGWKELKERVDTLITIPNQRLLNVVERKTSFQEAFKMADDVLRQAVKGISDIIIVPGLINVDFADVRTIMSETGMALMGTGSARGENRAIEAAQKAVASPLLEESSIEGATGVLINITGGPDLSLYEINEATSLIYKTSHEDAHIIFGSVLDENMGEEVRVTVIATGFTSSKKADEESGIKLRPVPSRDDTDIRLDSKVHQDVPPAHPRYPQAGMEGKDLDVPAFLRRKAD